MNRKPKPRAAMTRREGVGEHAHRVETVPPVGKPPEGSRQRYLPRRVKWPFHSTR